MYFDSISVAYHWNLSKIGSNFQLSKLSSQFRTLNSMISIPTVGIILYDRRFWASIACEHEFVLRSLFLSFHLLKKYAYDHFFSIFAQDIKNLRTSPKRAFVFGSGPGPVTPELVMGLLFKIGTDLGQPGPDFLATSTLI